MSKKEKTKKINPKKNQKRNKRSLGVVIVLSMLVCLLASNLFIAICSYKITEKELVDSAYTNIYNLIDAVAMDVDSVNDGYFSSLEVLSQVTLFRDTNNTLRQKTDWLNAISAVNKLFDNMMFIDINGNAIDEVGQIRNDSMAPYFTGAVQGRRLSLTLYFPSVW